MCVCVCDGGGEGVGGCRHVYVNVHRVMGSAVLQCVAVCCSVLQYVSVCRSVLQCVAVCCNALLRDECVCVYVCMFAGGQ